MRYKGSFTIEAALIMPMILGIIVLFIYASMYSHDRCVLEYAVNSEESGFEDRLILKWDTQVTVREEDECYITEITAQTVLFGKCIHTGRAYKHFCPKY